MGGVIRGDVGTALELGDVDHAGLAAVGRRPIVGAAGVVRADVAARLVVVDVAALGIDLQVAGRVVVDRLAGLGVDALGPGDLAHVLDRLDELAVQPVEHVIEAVAARMGDDPAILAVHLGVDEDMGAGLVVVAVVVRRVLEVPFELAGGGIDGEQAVGVEIVAGAIGGVVAGHRIARAPIGDVGRRVIGASDVERATPGLPGVALVLPGLAAGLARRGHGEGLPAQLAGLGVEPCDPVAQATVAAGGADDDGVLERERRRRELEVRLVAQVLVPDDLPGLLVGRDHPPVIGCHRDHQVAPQRHAAVAVEPLLPGIHLPDDAARGARAHVDLVDHAPVVGDVHEPVVHQRRRLEGFVAGGAADRDREQELHVLHVRCIDRIERGEPLRRIVAMVHEPVLRLRIEQALVGDVGGGCG